MHTLQRRGRSSTAVMEKLSVLEDSMKMLNTILQLFCMLILKNLATIDDKASVVKFEHGALQPQKMPARGAEPSKHLTARLLES
jgi:hypothetical protein